jgi:replicative DNA helicase
MSLINLRHTAVSVLSKINHKPGVMVGYPELDALTYGVRPTELVFLAGRPGMGKTSAMCDMILHTSKSGTPLIFSMEMGQEELIERLIVNTAGVSYQRAIRDTLQPNEKRKLMCAAEELSQRDVLIEGASLQSPQGVERTLASVINSGTQPSCVMIDHLNYMRSEKGYGDPYVEVTEITKYLKALAREYRLPFIVLAQLSRACEFREDHRPQLSDLRDSGSIEQDADQVWFLYRPGYYEPHSTSSYTEMNVAKNRNGATGTTRLNWNPATMSFHAPPSMSDI